MKELTFNQVKIITKNDILFNIEGESNCSLYIASNPIGDWITMSVALRLLCEKFKNNDEIKILEIGTAYGHFIHSMHQFILNVMKRKSTMYGLDSILHGYKPSFFNNENTIFIKGDSTDEQTISSVDNDFDFIFIDGCHCENHVFLDLKNFHSKIKNGGFIGLHDTLPCFQGGTKQPPTKKCSEDTSIGVVKGINKFNMEKHGFELLLEGQPLDKPYGGVRIYTTKGN